MNQRKTVFRNPTRLSLKSSLQAASVDQQRYKKMVMVFLSLSAMKLTEILPGEMHICIHLLM
jgi:hypothetical protein